MNQKFIILIIMLITVTSLYPKSDYQLFVDTYNNKNYAQALIHIGAAYADKPDDKNTYWYGITLYMNKKYAACADILQKLSPTYNSYPTGWYIGKSLLTLEDYAGTVAALQQYLLLSDDEDNWKTKLYPLYIEAHIALKDSAALLEMEPGLTEYYADKENDFGRIKYLLCKYFLDEALALITDNRDGLTFYKKAVHFYNMGLDDYDKYINLTTCCNHYFKQKKYTDALMMLALIPEDHQFYWTTWLRGSCYYKLEQKQECLESIQPAISRVDDYWTPFIYRLYVDSAADLNDYKAMDRVEKQFFTDLKGSTAENTYWIRYKVCRLYRDQIMEILAGNNQGDLSKRAALINKWYNAGLDKYKENININDLDFYIACGRYWDNHYSKKASSVYHHTMLGIIFNVDAVWKDKEGRQHSKKNTFDPSMLEAFERENEILRKLFFYLSSGKMVVDIDLMQTDSTITEFKYFLWESATDKSGNPYQTVDVIKPVFSTAKHYPAKIHFENRNNYDTFIKIYPAEGITGGGIGGKGILVFIPEKLNGTVSKGNISTAAESYSHRLIMHEFFHNIEGTYRDDYDFVAHIYKEDFKKIWPVWYKGEGELFYMQQIFKRIILPAGIDKLFFKEEKDLTDEETFYNLLKEL